MSFKDHFSRQAAAYARFRPQYPAALFEFLARMSPNQELAVDCATGNGQAAIALAAFFGRVIALDASAEQIAAAEPNERVRYGVARAEATGLARNSVSLLTVAQALHWLDLELFYAEARRILQRDGVLAAWAYNDLQIGPGIDAVVRRFHDEVVGPFWPPERRIVGRGYLDLPFPFVEIEAPAFKIEAVWSRQHLLGYLRSWSATQRYLAAKQSDPVSLIETELREAWGEGEKRVSWPLTLRTGQI